MKPLGKIENLHSWKSFYKNLNFFANWFSRWNEMINFKTSQTTCLKNENFYKPIWTMKWIDHHQNFNAQIDCSKNSFFSQTDPVYEMNWIISKLQSWNGLFEKLNFLANWSSLGLLDWIEILQSFINQITCSKKHRLFKVWFNF